MFQFTRDFGYKAIAYFCSIVIVGEMIFLNLFLAILLENFDMIEKKKDDEVSE
jgi:hypothetical protein